MRILILVAITASICGGCAPTGRYQIVPLVRDSASPPDVILLDTATGQTWRTTSRSEFQWSEMKRDIDSR